MLLNVRVVWRLLYGSFLRCCSSDAYLLPLVFLLLLFSFYCICFSFPTHTHTHRKLLRAVLRMWELGKKKKQPTSDRHYHLINTGWTWERDVAVPAGRDREEMDSNLRGKCLRDLKMKTILHRERPRMYCMQCVHVSFKVPHIFRELLEWLTDGKGLSFRVVFHDSRD